MASLWDQVLDRGYTNQVLTLSHAAVTGPLSKKSARDLDDKVFTLEPFLNMPLDILSEVRSSESRVSEQHH